MTTSEDAGGPESVPEAYSEALAAGVIDTMVTVPGSRDAWQQAFAGIVKDTASRELEHPAGYLFRDLPAVDGTVDFLAFLLAEMDRHGIARALLPVAEGDVWGRLATAQHPERLHGFHLVDPHDGSAGINALRRLHTDGHAIAAAVFPSGLDPGLAPDAPQLYPLYVTCCELDIPVFVNVGVPGPRMPMAPQHPGGLDRVCHDFPDLRVVCRHGGEPWEELLVRLMRSRPNLSYSTSAFAPRWYPEAIVRHANDGGQDQVMYAGYFPSGLSLDRIFAELPHVGFEPEVWPRFLRNNAARVLRLE
ncbi:MAG: amidohydrolase family protein [Actinomycetota bacterium]